MTTPVPPEVLAAARDVTADFGIAMLPLEEAIARALAAWGEAQWDAALEEAARLVADLPKYRGIPVMSPERIRALKRRP